MAHPRLRYVGAEGRPALLKVDVNFLDRVPMLSPARLQLRHPFGDDLPAIEMYTLAVPELAAAKTIALARRALARDLFDVAMLAELREIDDELLRAVLVVRGAGYPPPSPADYSPLVIASRRGGARRAVTSPLFVRRVSPSSWRSHVAAAWRSVWVDGAPRAPREEARTTRAGGSSLASRAAESAFSSPQESAISLGVPIYASVFARVDDPCGGRLDDASASRGPSCPLLLHVGGTRPPQLAS